MDMTSANLALPTIQMASVVQIMCSSLISIMSSPVWDEGPREPGTGASPATGQRYATRWISHPGLRTSLDVGASMTGHRGVDLTD
jgi:hypothetical protein